MTPARPTCQPSRAWAMVLERLGGLALAALLGSTAGCVELHEVDPLHAAQADSSAAGYVVGTETALEVQAAGPTDRRGSGERRMAGEASASPAGRVDSTTTGVTPAARAIGATDSATDRNRSSAPRDSMSPARTVAAVAGDSATLAGGASSESESSPSRTVANTSPDAATLPVALSTPVDDSIIVNTFLAYNPAARTVWVDLIAGFDGANGALNFNGGFGGSQALVVPVGWRVEVRFANRDHDLSHSVTVTRAMDPIPVIAPPAAFAGAFSIALEEGLTHGRNDSFRFSADRLGRYMILCAVPGHAQGGMWLRLDVSDTVTLPAYDR